ncbi:hypothetical protein Q4512_07540 [Oceanihabitans sp. 2_MG-2023]|uniref:hypothetical protein n=1 Tax=Oceanihabitans sp. 2_MG-2023 TaxID=3062661 RepID=UPI0026E330B5|nr:hypothetical protein [Oceanihabitans sp. 2_MG-2023]MDO6596764.1 hypothetical protein [Oceanihabitans sp. 2_MG-2023]
MNSKSFKYDIVFICIISLIPFLFYTYLFFPNNQTINIFGHVIRAGYYEFVDILFWHIFKYSLSLILFSVWFITCKYWWRFAILFLIYFEIRNISIVLYDTYYTTPNDSLILLISLLFIFLLIFISKKLNYFSFSKSINQKLDEEMDCLMNDLSKFKKKDYIQIKLKLTELRKEKQQLKKKEYLIRLIKLRDDFWLAPIKEN